MGATLQSASTLLILSTFLQLHVTPTSNLSGLPRDRSKPIGSQQIKILAPPHRQHLHQNYRQQQLQKQPQQQNLHGVSILRSSNSSESRVHKIKLIPKFIPFNSSELFFLRNFSNNFLHPIRATGHPHPSTTLKPLPPPRQDEFSKHNANDPNEESFADRPHNNNFYPSWFQPSPDTKNSKDSKFPSKELVHPRGKEDHENCRYDSIEVRSQLADVIFTGTIKKQSKGRQHALRGKRQIGNDYYKQYLRRNQDYKPHLETNGLSNHRSYFPRKYSYDFTKHYSNQPTLTNELLKYPNRNNIDSNQYGGHDNMPNQYYDKRYQYNNQHSDKVNLRAMKFNFPQNNINNIKPNPSQTKQADERDYYDIAKVEIKRILKGKEILDKYTYEDGAVGHGASKYFGKHFVTIYGLNNPSVCMGSASLHDTRIFPVKEVEDYLMLEFGMEKMSLNNLQSFDTAVSKEMSKTTTTTTTATHKLTHLKTNITQRPSTASTSNPWLIKTNPTNKYRQLSIDIISEPTDQRIEEKTSALFFCGAKTISQVKGVDLGKDESPIEIHPEIEWYRNYKEKIHMDTKNGIFIREAKESSNTLTSVLRLEGLKTDRSGVIECRASLNLWEESNGGKWMDTGRRVRKSASALLMVNKGIEGTNGFPRINLNPPVENFTSLIGKPLDLLCDGYARSPPNVSWLKDGLEPINYQSINQRVHVTSPGKLHFREVLKEDERLYECRATNMAGTSSRTINLKVTNNACDLRECKYGSTCQIDKITQEANCHCQQYCHSSGHHPVCGMDDVTYNNMCYLRQAECQEQRFIKIKFHGPCKMDDPCENVDCLFGSKCVIDIGGSATCECPDECIDRDKVKVCGTDDQTYENRCQLRRQSCIEQREIFVKFDGPCDPCQDISCHYGARCVPTSQHTASCQCTFDCNTLWKNNKICASDGKTYMNDCEMEKTGCLEQRHIEVEFDKGCDPCEDIECSYGAQCVSSNGKPSCKCLHSCTAGNTKVCGTDGRTYDSKCHLGKAACVLMIDIKVEFDGDCDPCEGHLCTFGSKCILNENRLPICECHQKCDDVKTGKVCGTDGKTYEGKCEMERSSCEQQKDIRVDFMGPCDPCVDHPCHYGGKCKVDKSINRPVCMCDDVCDEITDDRKLCGTDGNTYKNLCEMKIFSCELQRDIKVNYTGSCDLCEDMVCKFGSKCMVDTDGHHLCKCTQTCYKEINEQKVCGFDGNTYSNVCQLERTSCEEQREIKINYMGSCDPCDEISCKFGAKCEVTEQRHPVCVCMLTCIEDFVLSTKVCGTNGKTYSSHCEMEKGSCVEQVDIGLAFEGPCDPCEDHPCHYGGKCRVDKNINRPVCTCDDVCDEITDDRKLCGTDGNTYKNLCEMKTFSCEQQEDVQVNSTGSCDRCEDMVCKFGSKCMVDNDGHHLCNCTQTCDNEINELKVCGFDGNTYSNVCQLERTSCEEQREIRIEFTGSCDPCEDVKCEFGAQCLVDESRLAACYCTRPCNSTHMGKICGSDGVTYGDHCELETRACNEQRKILISSMGPCDSCSEVICHYGSQCQSDDSNLPTCICSHSCDQSEESSLQVCGSDGKTYANFCQLELASCQEQKSIQVVDSGKCDPCKDFPCHYGSHCQPDEFNQPSCKCPQTCQSSGVKVCGSDGRTYKDFCDLLNVSCTERKSIEVKFDGPCDPCLDLACPPNEICQIDLNKIPSCKCPLNCSDDVHPICANNGVTFTNECHMRHEACVSGDDLKIVANGECTIANNLCTAGACHSTSKCEVDPSGAPRCFCPYSCQLKFNPVCGSNGRSYDNECILMRQACIDGVNIEKLFDGACEVHGAYSCRNVSCGGDEVCVLKSGYMPECRCPSCSLEYKPVCGTGMITYTNECHLIRKRCMDRSSIEIVHDGSCDLCRDVECEYHGLCNSTSGLCECICDSQGTNDTMVCASNGMTYPSECYVNMMSCHSRIHLHVVHVGKCNQCIGVNCYYGAECEEGRCICKQECQAEDGKVCGTDGVTYLSECHLKVASCQRQTDVQISHVGRCDDDVTSEAEGSGGDDDASTETIKFEDTLGRPTDDPDGEGGSGNEGSGEVVDRHPLVVETSESYEDGSGNGNVKSIETSDRSRRDQCTEDNCKYGGRCEWNNAGQQFCNCQFKCDAIRSPVCGSDGKTYVNECEMNEFSCKIQSEITVQSYEICDDFFEEICDGHTPLNDPKTNKPLDCLVSKRCPTNSYCHVSGHVARCCPEENVCKCHPLGSFNLSCNLSTKQCPCKFGVIGKNCDRCNTNYWGIHKIQEGSQGCLHCQCNKFGSERTDCEQSSGRCICLEGVTGHKCDKCANGKKLSRDGCVDDRNRRSKPCPSEVACRFGATCQMTPDGPQCICPDTCSANDRFFADGVVCGTDNKVYASKCQLELATCRLQMDIKVLSYGPCPDSKSLDDSPKKIQQNKQKNPGDEIHHVYPSFSSQSWMKLRKPQFGSNDLTLNFELKASKPDGVVFYLGTNDFSSKQFMALTLSNGVVEIRYDFGNGYSVLRSSDKIREGSWHRIVASKFGKTVLLTMDNQLPYTRRDVGSLNSINLINHAYLGYPPGDVSRNKIGFSSGFQGCIKSFIINSSHLHVDYNLHSFAASKEVEEMSQLGNCKRSACAKFPCEHGGQCLDINDGKSFKCKCKEGFSGANCHIETLLFPCQTNPCLNDGTCVATDDGAYVCKCPEQFSGHHCHVKRS